MTPLLVAFFYINLAALLFSLAGWLAEWMLLAHRRRVRWLWTAVMFVSVLFPLALILWGEQLLLVSGLSTLDEAVVEGLLRASGNEVAYTAGDYRLESGFDGWIQRLWGATTGATLLWLAWSAYRLRSARSRWLRTESDGHPFYITPSVGPGVLGVIRQRILMPHWCLGLEEEARELIWQHEREHVRAGDNRYLAIAFALVVAFPWVLPLWWQFRRLRVAVELDCDRRVVSRHSDWKGYGKLLIRVAAGSELLPVAPFAGRSSPLRRRIRWLPPDRPRHRRLRSAAAALAMCLLVMGWLALPVPAQSDNWSLLPLPIQVVQRTLAPPQPEYDQDPEMVNRDEFERAADRRYPEGLRARGVEGEVGLLIHVARDGSVDRVRLHKPSEHGAFDRAAKEVARIARFRPARSEGAPVDVWLFLKVSFTPPE